MLLYVLATNCTAIIGRLPCSTRRLLANDSQAGSATQADSGPGRVATAAAVLAAAAKRRSKVLAGLPGLAAWKRSFNRNVPMPRPHSSAFPPWGPLRSLPRRGLGCLAGGNVKRRGVGLRGNGVANEAPALAKVDKARGVRFHYFPPGTYRIRTSLTLAKPVVMGRSGGGGQLGAGIWERRSQIAMRADPAGVGRRL